MSQSTSLGRILRHPVANAEARESSALLVAAVALIVGVIPGIVVFWGREVPISGRGSFGDFAAIGSAVAALLAFLFGCLLRRTQHAPAHRWRRLHWFDVAALCLAHAIIALLGWVGLASVFSSGFEGARLYATSAAVLAAIVMAITAYAAFLSAVGLTPMLLSLVLAVFLFVGALASMLSASDPLWWQENLSTLGISDDISAMAFNVTLVIAGVMVTTISHYATVWLPTSTHREARGRTLVRAALILIGVLLACVGLFPLDENLAIHNVSASGMVAVFVATVIALPTLVPSTPRVFVVLGYVFVGVIVVLAIFFFTGYYNLTAVELIAFALVFTWVIVFLRNTGSLQPDTVPEQAADHDDEPVEAHPHP